MKKLPKNNTPSTLNQFNLKIFLNAKDRVISPFIKRHKMWDPFQTKVFCQEIKNGNVVIDIGANVGYYSMLASKLVGSKGLVLAFEPEESNYRLLKKNIRVNGLKNVRTYQLAVSDNSGTATLYKCSKNHGDHRLYNSGDGRKENTVRTVSLDDFMDNKVKKVDFIKMDIQGWELKVLRGMKRTITRNPPLKMITEFWPSGLRNAGNTAPEYYKMLHQLGFAVYNINELKHKIERFSNRLFSNYETNLLCLQKPATSVLAGARHKRRAQKHH